MNNEKKKKKEGKKKEGKEEEEEIEAECAVTSRRWSAIKFSNKFQFSAACDKRIA